MTIKSIARTFSAKMNPSVLPTNAQQIEMKAVSHRKDIFHNEFLFAIKAFFASGCSIKGMKLAFQERNNNIKDELGLIALNIVSKYNINMSARNTYVNLCENKEEKYSIVINQIKGKDYLSIWHHDTLKFEILHEVTQDLIDECHAILHDGEFSDASKLVTNEITHIKKFQNDWNSFILKNPNQPMDNFKIHLIEQYNTDHGIYFWSFINNSIETEEIAEEELLKENKRILGMKV